MFILLSLLSGIISITLCIVVFYQYFTRKKVYQLVWAISLGIFATAIICQIIASLWGWNEILYRLWYLLGALLEASFLGQGTIYLVSSKRFADISLKILTILSLIGVLLLIELPVDMKKAVVEGVAGGNGFSPIILLLVIPLNIYGATAFVGGALYSVYGSLKLRKMQLRTYGTLLIALGGIIASLGGSAVRLGFPSLLYIAELLGILCVFCGFMLASKKA